MNSPVYYILLGLTIITNAGGGLLMKIGAKTVNFGQGESIIETIKTLILNWQLILGIFSYGLSFVFATLVYTKINLNIAYPIMVGTSFLLISLASLVFLKEQFTPIQVLGSIFLVIGIFMIGVNLKEG